MWRIIIIYILLSLVYFFFNPQHLLRMDFRLDTIYLFGIYERESL